jgi:hypothetical protein
MIKSAMLLSAAFFCTLASKAQILKGAKWLGGSVSVSSEVRKNDPNKLSATNYYINPAYGIATKENQIVGAELELGYGKSKSDNGTTELKNSEEYTVGAAVFKRWYKPLGKNFYLFGHLRGGVSWNHRNVKGTPPQNDENNYKTIAGTVSFYPGLSYALTNKVHIETGFNNLAYVQFSSNQFEYLQNGQLVGNKSVTNRFMAGSSLSNQSWFYVGVRVLLNGTAGKKEN